MNGFINAFLIIGTSALLLLALLAFEKAMRQGDKARLYLVVFLLVSALYFTSYGLYCCAPSPYNEIGGAFKIPLVLAFIPLFFLFLRDLITGTTQQFSMVIKHLILPVLFIASAPLLLVFPESDVIIGRNQVGYTLRFLLGHLVLMLQTVFYTLRMFRRYARYSGKLQKYYQESDRHPVKIRNLLLSFVIFLLVLDNWLMTFLIPQEVFPLVYPVLLFSAAFITGWLGLAAPACCRPASSPAVVPEKKSDIPAKESVVARQPVPVNGEAEDASAQVNGRIPFGDSKKKALYEHLLRYLKESEAYTNPKLTLKQLASDLDTNTRYLSMVINEFEGCNFNQMLNRYRVNKVIQLLVDNQAESYSYLGLAQKAGFHSKSVFISAFKAQTGSTPTEFAGSMKKLIQN
ncbi:protein containing helix-turn-helix domain [Lentimicrobium saccharophilum]|uniref:Protein containing helix-turn-helix domain n=1 Tax=Lentimicrobium saccharophilum TaxID=1678841 RepID=A0A0S7C0A1_9BACT|nr:helix-turn-helix domain-containing protein [Lentimicrobium saccharophilum]GAP42742.1 protein containing helix-turn-helix domain [Lentimicrobium saccharophilum]